MPTVSIIIPTYNRADLIGETLESIFAQTYTDYEVIVVDDGSTDKTEEVIAPYINRIRYVKQENAGVSVARNRGMLEATGEFIAFLDSDDLWYPEKLEKQVALMREHPEVGMSYTDYVISADPSGLKISWMSKYGLETKSLIQILAKGSICLTPTVLFRRELLPKIGLMDSVLFASEDYDFWLKIIHHTQTMFLNEILVFCREHPNRSGKSKKMYYGNNRSNSIQLARWEGIMNPELFEQMQEYSRKSICALAWFERYQGNIRVAGENFLKASRVGKFQLSLFVRGLLLKYCPWIVSVKNVFRRSDDEHIQ